MLQYVAWDSSKYLLEDRGNLIKTIYKTVKTLVFQNFLSASNLLHSTNWRRAPSKMRPSTINDSNESLKALDGIFFTNKCIEYRG